MHKKTRRSKKKPKTVKAIHRQTKHEKRQKVKQRDKEERALWPERLGLSNSQIRKEMYETKDDSAPLHRPDEVPLLCPRPKETILGPRPTNGAPLDVASAKHHSNHVGAKVDGKYLFDRVQVVKDDCPSNGSRNPFHMLFLGITATQIDLNFWRMEKTKLESNDLIIERCWPREMLITSEKGIRDTGLGVRPPTAITNYLLTYPGRDPRRRQKDLDLQQLRLSLRSTVSQRHSPYRPGPCRGR